MEAEPKPTHPTHLALESEEHYHLLYDTLSPHDDKPPASYTSGKDLPNPLYSGLPVSAANSRPTSQYHDSGSGNVRHNSGNGVVWYGSQGAATVDELQYAVGNDQSSVGFYTEPTVQMSRPSQYIEQHYSPPPPLPPHPRDSTPYAEAGPPSREISQGAGELAENNIQPPSPPSQEHLYSELKEYNRRAETSPRVETESPVLQVPSPPPPVPPSKLGESREPSSSTLGKMIISKAEEEVIV